MTGRMDHVIRILRTDAAVCSIIDFYGNALANARNDVGRLRARGWVIESWWTAHGGANHKHYRLLREGPPKQMRLAV